MWVLQKINKHPYLSAVLALIVLVASYFRLYQLPETVHFMGDQGRDALVVSRIFTDRDLVFIGPVTSVGNMYLGPFYYYFMLPFLYLSYPSPLGPTYAVAVVNILAVFLMYFWGRELIGGRAALLGAGMMAVSHVAISLSRFSWNPNIAPLVALAMMMATYYAWKKNPNYWVLVGVCFGLLIQLHYVTVLAAAASGVVLLWQLWEKRENVAALKQIGLGAVGGVVATLVLLLPLFLFDLKHDWANADALKAILFEEEAFVRDNSTVSEKVGKLGLEILDRAKFIVFESTMSKNSLRNTQAIMALVVIFLAYYKLYWKRAKKNHGLALVLIYLVIGIVGFSLYEHNVYHHYIAYLFPAVFLTLGFALAFISRIKLLGWVLVTAFALFYVNYNVRNVIFDVGGPSQEELRVTAESIHARVADNEPYAIVLLSESRDIYGMNYRYFLSTNPSKRPLDPERNAEAQKLFIINEEQVTDQPQALGIYEIVIFENKEPAEVYSLPQGISVMVLSANSDKSP